MLDNSDSFILLIRLVRSQVAGTTSVADLNSDRQFDYGYFREFCSGRMAKATSQNVQSNS
jgi:hypothetical protein